MKQELLDQLKAVVKHKFSHANKIMYNNLRMYIMIPDNVPDEFAPVATAHASLACYDKFYQDLYMREWFEHSFKKVVCKVSTEEFDEMVYLAGFSGVVITESNLDNMPVALAMCPRVTWPYNFVKAKLWKPKKK